MASFKITCFALLIASALIMSVSAHHPPGSPCWPDPEKGNCDQKLTRYFHNHNDDKCETFIYSGCGGNANNFKTHDECHKECSHELNGHHH